MKKRILTSGSLGLVLCLFPLVSGCNSEATEPPANVAGTNVAAPAVSTPAIVALPATNEAAAEIAEPAGAVDLTNNMPPPPAGTFGKPAPADVPLTGPVSEVVKMVDAGVSEDILLSYVNNSGSGFGLGSAQIIYLNDIGVPDSVVNAMMQRDQALKSSGASYAAPAAQPAIVNLPPEVEETNPPVEEEPPPVSTEPGPTVVNYNYFHETLSPYGTWVEVDNYGWCWRPTVVVSNPGWRPYCDRGRWIYTDCGWYWYSDYTWGAVAFHYGRWFQHPRMGWCWYPDRTWGPAWVSWRYDNSHCGWAPLPPAARFSVGVGVTFGHGFSFDAGWFTFVPWRSFCDPRPWRHRVPHDRLVVVFNNSRPCDNVRWDRHRVFNHGIAPERVSEFSHQKVRQYTVRDRNDGRDHRGGRQERIDHVNRTVFDSRPPVHQGNFNPGKGQPNRTQFDSRKHGGEAAFTPTSPKGPDNRTQFESRPAGQEGLFTPPQRETSTPAKPNWSDRQKSAQPRTGAPQNPPAQDNPSRPQHRDNRRDNDRSRSDWQHRGAPVSQAQAPSAPAPVVQAPVQNVNVAPSQPQPTAPIVVRNHQTQPWQLNNRGSSPKAQGGEARTFTPQDRGSFQRPAPSAPSYTPPAQTFTPPAQVNTPAPRPVYTPPPQTISPPQRPTFTPPARSEPRQENRAPVYAPPPRSSPPPSAPPPQSAPSRQSPSGGRDPGHKEKGK